MEFFDSVFLTPPSLRATSPIFLRCKNTEEEGEMYPSPLSCPVILRDTTREEYEILVDGIGRELIKLYKNEREAKNLLPFRVIELGFEPKTHSLEGCCSIQLSYSTDLL